MTGATLDPNATYQATDVARILFHVSARTFRRRLKKLRCEGFPRPISQWGVKVWSGHALLSWLSRDQSIGEGGPNVASLGATLALRAREAARQGARQGARSKMVR